jgi:hypothetical protein
MNKPPKQFHGLAVSASLNRSRAFRVAAFSGGRTGPKLPPFAGDTIAPAICPVANRGPKIPPYAGD